MRPCYMLLMFLKEWVLISSAIRFIQARDLGARLCVGAL